MKYEITYDGKVIGRINERLAIKQMVSDESIKKIVTLHALKYHIFKLMCASNDVTYIRACAEIVTDIEFALQFNWNFTQDASFHEWYNVPKCSCPKLDNFDAKGCSAGQVINLGCIIHGELK